MIALLTTALGGVLVAGPDANAALRWTAPPDCPSRAQVGVWLQEAGGDAVSTTTEVEIRQPAPDRWVVRIAMRDDENATRTIEGETCEAVTRAAVVALALAGGEQAQAAARGPDDAAPRPTIAATDPPGQRSAAAAAFDPADTMPQEERMPTRAIDDPEPRVRATGVRARLSASGARGVRILARHRRRSRTRDRRRGAAMVGGRRGASLVSRVRAAARASRGRRRRVADDEHARRRAVVVARPRARGAVGCGYAARRPAGAAARRRVGANGRCAVGGHGVASRPALASLTVVVGRDRGRGRRATGAQNLRARRRRDPPDATGWRRSRRRDSVRVPA